MINKKNKDIYCYLVKSNIVHYRNSNPIHKFQQFAMSILIDLDNLEKANKQSILFSVNRFNLFSFYEKDFGPNNSYSKIKNKSKTKLSIYIRNLAKKINFKEEIKKIELLTFPRILGLSFNPLSVYRCINASNKVCLIIYEVHNTYKESHSYVTTVNNINKWHEVEKLMFVSPFFPIDGKYFLRTTKTKNCINVYVKYFYDNKLQLNASLNGKIINLSTFNLMKELFIGKHYPMKPLIKIHFEAIKLFFKRFKYYGHYIIKKKKLFCL